MLVVSLKFVQTGYSQCHTTHFYFVKFSFHIKAIFDNKSRWHFFQYLPLALIVNMLPY